MITFQHTRTNRIAVGLAELTLGQGIALCKLPAQRSELTTTELLRYVAAAADKPRHNYVTDPLLWTVQERALLVCRYLAQVTSDGPDFSVGGDGHLSDYVMFDRDLAVDQVALGMVAGKDRTMRPLLGVHAQTLEKVCKSRGDWVIGAIAFQISEAAEQVPDWGSMSDVAMLQWITDQMDAIKALPESMFEEVFAAYWRGADALAHFFNLDFDADGPVFQPVEKEGDEALAPARFLASSCVSGISRSFAG